MAERNNTMKKQYILFILEILKEYTDEYNPMDLVELKEKLSNKPYEVNIERKAIWRSIDDLIELGYPIMTTNTLKNGSEVFRDGKPLRQQVYYDYSQSDITDSQIWLLIDTVLASSHIKDSYADATVEWLRNQASVSFRKTYANVSSSDYGYHIKQNQIFYTIETIDSAVRNDNQISFTYNDFNIDGELKTKYDGVIVSPYYTVIRNGHYYLIGCRDGENEFYHYRIDKISNANVLKNTNRCPLSSINENFNLNEYIQQHPYMFAGDVSQVRILINKNNIGALYDYFGNKAFSVSPKIGDDDKVEVTLKTNINGFYYFALQYGDSVEVLEPQKLRDKIRKAVRHMVQTYSITNEDIYSEALKSANDNRRIYNEAPYTSLNLAGINLQGKRDHTSIEDVVYLTVGYNEVSSYEFIKKYKKLNTLRVVEPAILNDLYLTLSDLGFLEIREKIAFSDEGYDSIPTLKDLNCISGCKNLMYINVESGKIDSFEGIYDLTELECISVPKEYLAKIDLSRFQAKARVSRGDICQISFDETIKRHRKNR